MNRSTATSTARPIPSCVIFLNGFPGVGKLTIARKLHSTSTTVETRLVDNHLLIDTAEAISPGRSEHHYQLCKSFRKLAFEGIQKLPQKQLAVIITGCCASDLVDREVFLEHVEIARARHVPFISININCNEDVNVMRLQSRASEGFVGKKLTDPGVLRLMRLNHKMLNQQNFGIHAEDIFWLEIDSTELGVDDSAEVILRFLGDLATSNIGYSERFREIIGRGAFQDSAWKREVKEFFRFFMTFQVP